MTINLVLVSLEDWNASSKRLTPDCFCQYPEFHAATAASWCYHCTIGGRSDVPVTTHPFPPEFPNEQPCGDQSTAELRATQALGCVVRLCQSLEEPVIYGMVKGIDGSDGLRSDLAGFGETYSRDGMRFRCLAKHVKSLPV